jgi:hypothetical protein
MEVSNKLQDLTTLPKGKGSYGASFIRDWVGPRATLETKEKEQTIASVGYLAPIPRSFIL